jgi:hypothetical protein
LSAFAVVHKCLAAAANCELSAKIAPPPPVVIGEFLGQQIRLLLLIVQSA